MITYQCLAFKQLSLQQLYDIMVLRQQVFVVEQHCPYLDADGKDPQAHHLLGLQNGALRSYARLLPPGSDYPDYAALGRIVTHPSARQKGLGRDLLRRALSEVTSLYGPVGVKISAQTYLIRFYESFGFAKVGEEYLEDDIPHIGMVLLGDW